MCNSEFKVGELRRNRLLGSAAVYRIYDWDRELVRVEVVSAPGLTPGKRVRFTAEAVRRMDVVDDVDGGRFGE